MTAIDFESFKESGGIEYTADVVWGLPLQCIHEGLFSSPNKINEKRQRIREAKRETPRKIELVCLKNRFGISSYTCQFNYYPNFDLFDPDLTKICMDDVTDNNSDTDGWMAIPKGLEYEIPWELRKHCMFQNQLFHWIHSFYRILHFGVQMPYKFFAWITVPIMQQIFKRHFIYRKTRMHIISAKPAVH